MLQITKDNFGQEVLKNEKPVLLDFGAPWCMPCKQLAKTCEELEKEQDAVKIAKINIEECPEIAAKYGVMTIPALLFFKNGKVVDKMMGAKNKKAILKMLNK